MTSKAAPMKTELSSFCQDYSKLLLPLRRELGKTIDFIRDKRDTDEIRKTLSNLCDAHHRLKTLAEKIESQQAYVIIFGPLKSGKSTLMNAFSGAYVSEVTALPAYPCLVHVRHEEQVSLSASRFNGQTESFEDFSQMQSAVEVYHRELAEKIREVEENDGTFEPGIHSPNAIRRLDIGLPAEPLKESYTILVDTPGLYSRMKFGYDLMSREFRDSAACAVFVVKTDNLFLEQVFEEFNDLLNLFSRIFLVVNIDGHKYDLEPDGDLRPSLESREPQKIVDAFCSLSMSAPLRHAYEEGRLKIYPIDLLKAASERLGKEGAWPENEIGAEKEEGENQSNLVSSESGGDDDQQSGTVENSEAVEEDIGSGKFNQFMVDLTDYLNSNDYLVHFMRDSLRQGRQLISEVEEGCRQENLRGFSAGLKSMQADHDRLNEQRQALGRLRKLDWREAFGGVLEQLKQDGENYVQSERDRLESELAMNINEWFSNTASLKHLLEEQILPVFESLPEKFQEYVLERLQEATNTSVAGAVLSDADKRDIEKVELALTDIRQQALEAAYELSQKISMLEPEIGEAAMPVRRRFWDWLFFRGKNRLRTKFFGPDSSKEISIKIKQSRLGEKSRHEFFTNVQEELQKIMSKLSKNIVEDIAESYATAARDGIDEVLKSRIEDSDQKLPRLQQRIQARQEVLKAIDKLSRQIKTQDQDLAALENTFAQEHPAPEPEAEEPDLQEEDG